MTLDEYRDLWRSETSDTDAPDEKRLLERVRDAPEAFDRKIRRRDLLETLAGVIVAAAFGYEAATVETWMARLGALIVVGSSAFVVW